MREAWALLAAASMLAGCAVLSPAAEVIDPDAGFPPIQFDDVAFHEQDLGFARGLRLHADVYLPADPRSPDAPTRFPTILVLSPYFGEGTGGNGTGYKPYDFLVTRLLPRGYAVVFGDLASGGSSGCWDFMGPVERANAVAMVEAVAAQPWSDGKVGMMGISYDAMTQIMAASDQAPHLTTIVAAAPLTHAYGGLMQNGVHYGASWHLVSTTYEGTSLTPPAMNPERYPGWMDRATTSAPCMIENHAGEPPTNAYTAYLHARDYRALGSQVRASVFYMQGLQDAKVKPDNFGEWFDAVPTLKKAWIGQWNHQHPTALGAGREDMYLTVHRWFDHELKGIANGIDAEPAFDVQDSLGQWRHESGWPPPDRSPLVLRLSADGALTEGQPTPGKIVFGGAVSLADTLAATEMGTATFEALAFPEGARIAGAPTLHVRVASDRPTGQIVARLFDGDELVSQGAYDLLYTSGLDEPVPLRPGVAVELSFSLYPTDHVVRPGGALRLVLATQDALGWYDRDASAAQLTLLAGDDATLTLPTIARGDDAIFLVSCGVPLRPPVPDCWKDAHDQGV